MLKNINSIKKPQNVVITIAQWLIFFFVLIVGISATFSSGNILVFAPFGAGLFFIIPESAPLLEKFNPQLKKFSIRIIVAVPFIISGFAMMLIFSDKNYAIYINNKPKPMVFSSSLLIEGRVTGKNPKFFVNGKELSLKKSLFHYTWNLKKGKKNSITFILYEKKTGTDKLIEKKQHQLTIFYTNKMAYLNEKDRKLRILLLKARYDIHLHADTNLKEIKKREMLIQAILDLEHKYNIQLDKKMSANDLAERKNKLQKK